MRCYRVRDFVRGIGVVVSVMGLVACLSYVAEGQAKEQQEKPFIEMVVPDNGVNGVAASLKGHSEANSEQVDTDPHLQLQGEVVMALGGGVALQIHGGCTTVDRSAPKGIQSVSLFTLEHSKKIEDKPFVELFVPYSNVNHVTAALKSSGSGGEAEDIDPHLLHLKGDVILALGGGVFLQAHGARATVDRRNPDGSISVFLFAPDSSHLAGYGKQPSRRAQ